MADKDIKRRVLEQLAENLKEADVASSLLTIDEHPELKLDVLTALYTEMGADEADVVVEMGFSPIVAQGNEGLLCFAASAMLAENLVLSPERLAALIETANAVNRYLPLGHLIIDPDMGAIVYKVTTIIPSYLPVKDMTMLAETCAGACYAQSNLFVYPFTRLAIGSMSAEEVLEGLLG